MFLNHGKSFTSARLQGRAFSILFPMFLIVSAIPVRALAQSSVTLVEAVQTISVDAAAIQDGNEPNNAVKRQAAQIRFYVTALPTLTSGQSGSVLSVEVRLKEDAARLMAHANAEDFFAAGDTASDLLSDLDTFRQLMKLPR